MTNRGVGALSFGLQHKEFCCLYNLNSIVQLLLYTNELFQYSLFLLQFENFIYSLLSFDVLCFCVPDSYCRLTLFLYLPVSYFDF